MKKHFYLLILLGQILPLYVFGQTSVMSLNIRYDNPRDNENWWGHRKAAVVNMLHYYSPQIIGIQEGLHNQVEYIATGLADYDYIGMGRDDGKTKGEYTAVFYKKAHLKLLSTKTYWLSETPNSVSVGWDASMERIVTFGEFLVNKTKEKLFVFNCHFDHRGPKSRKKSAELILKIIQDKGIDDGKIIVMGDLNCEPESEPIKILKRELNDAFSISKSKPYGPIGTFNGFDTERLMDRRIDYVFVKNVEVLRHAIIDDRRPNNLYLSDHLPVMAEIK